MMLERPGFSIAAMRAGAAGCAPLIVGMIPFGLVVGILAQGDGLSLLEAVTMSALVFAGSAQLLVLGHWGMPAPIVGALLATAVINLRMALMGPVIAPWLDRLRGWRLFASLFVLTDQNWAMSVSEMQAGRRDAGYLFASGVTLWGLWVLFTAVGHVVGGVLRPPPGHPIFFAALAVFVSILVPMWRGRGDLVPWVAAAAAALLVAWLAPGGSWHIIAGALAGAGAGVLRDRGRAA